LIIWIFFCEGPEVLTNDRAQCGFVRPGFLIGAGRGALAGDGQRDAEPNKEGTKGGE
jgi:hypothetical protein